jgi:hypothetical protein
MSRYQSVVVVKGTVYEGEIRSDPDKAKASAARVALGRLGMDNGVHISNERIFRDLQRYCQSHGQPQPVYDDLNPHSYCKLSVPFHQDVVNKCSSILQLVCKCLGKLTSCANGVQAAVILKLGSRCEIVAATKGNDFISESQKLTNSHSIRDCHAEILARRGLILFILREMEKANRGVRDCCVEKHDKYDYSIKQGVEFHLYVSKVPCGDAAVSGGEKPGHLRLRCTDGEGSVLKAEPDHLYKMCCSDKIALWNVVGVQGALLSHLLRERVFFTSITVRGGERSAMSRAFSGRLEGIPLKVHTPQIIILGDPKVQIASTAEALCWVTNDHGGGEVITTSTGEQEKGSTDVSKHNLFKLWMGVAQCKVSTYQAYKLGAEQYQEDKKKFQEFLTRKGLGSWYHKPQNADNFQ